QPAPDSQVQPHGFVLSIDVVHVVAFDVRHHFQCQLIMIAQEQAPLAGSGKWKAMWNSSPSAKYGLRSAGHWLASANSIRPGNCSSSLRRMSFRMACV